MALLDAYATGAQYLARTGEKVLAADATLADQLLGNSRLLELALKCMVGAWNTHTGTYVFDAHGGAILRLRDSEGLQYFVTAITSLKLDTDLDGSFDDYTWTLSDTWLRGLPANAAAASRPFKALELRPTTTAPLVTWPRSQGSVQLIGTCGWAAVPKLVTDLVCHRTYEMRQAHKEGLTGTLPAFDAGVPMRDQTAWLWKQAEIEYGAAGPRSRAV